MSFYIDITPKMTSNNTPSPYVVTSSTPYNDTYLPWKAFNGTAENNTDAFCCQTSSGWIQLDFSKPTRISKFGLACRFFVGAEDWKTAPKRFILYGSNDGSIYHLIKDITKETQWTSAEFITIDLETDYTFRYFKIELVSTFGGTNVNIVSYIKFFQYQEENVRNKNMTLKYCLPYETTDNIKKIKDDLRKGLLAYSDDTKNYGTLWMIGKSGKAIVPKAAQSMEILFDGAAKLANTQYALIDSYKNYSSILIIGGVDDGNRILDTLLIPVSMILNNMASQLSLGYFYKSSADYGCTIQFQFDTENSFKINTVAVVGWNNAAISKIIGIK